MAQIGSSKTDDWLLDVLATATVPPVDQLLELVATRASEAFQRLQIPHAFLASGWARMRHDGGRVAPFMVAISNPIDDDWNWQRKPTQQFQIRVVYLGAAAPFAIKALGVPIDADTKRTLTRRVHAISVRDDKPELLVAALAAAIRSTADANRFVGKNLMAVSLPRLAPTRPVGLMVHLGGQILTDAVVAVYLPAARSQVVMYGPHFVSNMGASKNLKIYHGSDS